MAKKEGEEEYEFQVPDFDEDAFIHKEMVSFKTTSVLFLWGIIAALVTWAVFTWLDGAKTGWYVGLLIAAAFGYGLKLLYPRLKIDISHFQRREWMGTGFLFFFTWLAILMLLLNPPFSDFSEPRADVYVSPTLQQVGGDLRIDLSIEDNAGIEAFTFTVTRGNQTLWTEADMEDLGHGNLRLELTAPEAGQYQYTATATDKRGHETTTTGMFQVRSNALRLVDTDITDGTLDIGDQILVTLLEDVEVRTVYLDMLDRDQIVFLEFDEKFGGWTATSNFAGWQTGDNTFRVVAETPNQFDGARLLEGGDIVLNGPFTVDVPTASGDHVPAVQPEVTVSPNVQRTPGLGIPVLIGAILVVAIARRR